MTPRERFAAGLTHVLGWIILAAVLSKLSLLLVPFILLSAAAKAAAMFALLVCGMLVIVCNYLGVLPGGDAQNSDLILGLVLMVGGFVLSTQYH